MVVVGFGVGSLGSQPQFLRTRMGRIEGMHHLGGHIVVGRAVDEEHRTATTLHSLKGRFLLSYNDCPQVRELYADCIIEPVSRRNTLSAQSVDGYKEVLVRNYEL